MDKAQIISLVRKLYTGQTLMSQSGRYVRIDGVDIKFTNERMAKQFASQMEAAIVAYNDMLNTYRFCGEGGEDSNI